MQSSKESVVHIESLQNRVEASNPPVGSLPATKRNSSALTKLIMVVDDNDELRAFISDSLSDEYAICEAIDGVNALELMKEKRPDLVITDVMMPVMDGIELCCRIKEDPLTAHTPVLMLSAKAAIESRLEGAASGADYYFSKPLDINLLLLNIRNIFARQSFLQQHIIQAGQVQALANTHSSKDKEFLNQLALLLDENLSNPDLDVDFICRRLVMSRTKLYQTIKNITGQSITDFIRSVRLQKAVQIMTEEDVSITDVMYRVGMQTQSYFTKAFKKEFGKTPTQFLQELGK